MKMTTIGRGNIGGTLARLWASAGHEVTQLGRGGGDAGNADVVLLAVPSSAVEDALDRVTALNGKIVVDATNRLRGEAPPSGHASVAEYVASRSGGPVAKAFNLNFGNILAQAATATARPHNIWVGDETARAAVEQLSHDSGLTAVNAGPLDLAGTQEAFAKMLMGIVSDVGAGLLFYRFATPGDL